jgi:hypothetical protein
MDLPMNVTGLLMFDGATMSGTCAGLNRMK